MYPIFPIRTSTIVGAFTSSRFLPSSRGALSPMQGLFILEEFLHLLFGLTCGMTKYLTSCHCVNTDNACQASDILLGFLRRTVSLEHPPHYIYLCMDNTYRL